MSVARPLVLLFCILCLAQAAAAQLLGSYEVTNVDGSPLEDGVKYTTDISTTPSGDLVGSNFVDYGQGEGPELLPEEEERYTMLGVGGLEYLWINARGTIGLTYWSHTRNQFESTVLTGANAGRTTALRPM